MNKHLYLEEVTNKFKSLLEEDFKNNKITEDEYNLFSTELKYSSIDEYKYGLYTAYLIMRRWNKWQSKN